MGQFINRESSWSRKDAIAGVQACIESLFIRNPMHFPIQIMVKKYILKKKCNDGH